MSSINLTRFQPPSENVLNHLGTMYSDGEYNTPDSDKLVLLTDKFKEIISSYEKMESSKYTYRFTDSYLSIFTDIALNYAKETRQVAHIIIGGCAYQSVFDHLEFLKSVHMLQYTVLEVGNKYPFIGAIEFSKIKSLIRRNTCLISIDAMNRSVGCINDLEQIGAICHKYNIPLHSDVTNFIDLYEIKPSMGNIDIFSIRSKLACIHVLKTSLVEGYSLTMPTSIDIHKLVCAFIEYNNVVSVRDQMRVSCISNRECFIQIAETYFQLYYPDLNEPIKFKKLISHQPIMVIVNNRSEASDNKLINCVESTILISIYDKETKGRHIYHVQKKLKQEGILIDCCLLTNSPKLNKYRNDVVGIVNKLGLPNVISIYLNSVGKTEIKKFISVLRSSYLP